MTDTTLIIPSDGTPPPVTPKIARWFLQAGHRMGFVALLAFLATWGMYYKGSRFDLFLAAAAGASDLGLCSAMLAKLIARRYPRRRREGTGVLVFNAVIFLLSLNLMIYARMPVVRHYLSDLASPAEPEHR